MRTKARRCFYTESERTAYYLSEYMRKPWYVCESEERQDLVLSDENLKRYMKLGYTV